MQGQFKEAFKYVVADKLFVQSGKSNCKIDNDKILLDISNVAMAKYIKPVPRNVEKPPTTESSPSHNTSTVSTNKKCCCLSGWVHTPNDSLVNECGECSDQLLLPQLPSEYDELSAYEFLRNKTYKEARLFSVPYNSNGSVS